MTRRILLVLCAVLVGSAVLLAAIPFTDAFTRANGALGTNWTAMGDGLGGSATLNIVSNAVQADPGFPCSMASIANVGTFNANQKAQITFSALGVNDGGGPIVRASGNWGSTTFTGYLLNLDNGTGVDAVVNNSGITILTGLGTSWAAGDIARLEVEGTTIRVYKNGGQIGSASNSSIASGQPGFCGFDSASPSSGDLSLDDFTADNISAAVTTRTLLLLGVGHHP